ncbi:MULTISPECIES: uroporphyrinogen-III synthase [Mesobacillus]|uniref:Uroporphyrinogen-III synthase n=2 Tax=Mesobacillus TaxID=2675231 RepID=A0A0D6ZCT7_9BACI|nr:MULTISPECIES: uroporphyrinogen-III synthase [Mesobacillus]KIY22393.1 uroporphyrinogen-III synthase [Mesobacillus subterraneus]MDQ0414162.1 uroporphyrinogen-III synthase [Mesobacillus stamsii]
MIAAFSLQNRTVLIPRGKAHAKRFSELVARHRGIPVEIPLIAFQPVAATQKLLETLQGLHHYDWIIFTSNVTVETFFSFFEKKKPSLPKIAVIGDKTKASLEERGEKVDFLPQEYVAERFTEEFLPYVKAGDKVLIPKGNLARDYISSSLKKKGAIVEEIIIYETYLPQDSKDKLVQMLSEERLDILTFTSPSTIDHFMGIVEDYHLRDKLAHCIVACIGPVSKRKAEQWGLKVDAMPEKYTVEEMLKSVAEYVKIGG